MSDTTRLKWLKIALFGFGVVFLFIYPLGMVWPSGWSWHMGYSDYFLMIVGVYATLGVFLIAAARDPLANRSLVQFTIWSSAVHGLIMLFQSLAPGSHGHLMGDVPALFLVAVVLSVLLPREQRAAVPLAATS
ncbi:MAG TPA: DUF6632 domain-containing protein [Thermoanaerobaculia bacterium]|jgi:hypothetical protein